MRIPPFLFLLLLGDGTNVVHDVPDLLVLQLILGYTSPTPTTDFLAPSLATARFTAAPSRAPATTHTSSWPMLSRKYHHRSLDSSISSVPATNTAFAVRTAAGRATRSGTVKALSRATTVGRIRIV